MLGFKFEEFDPLALSPSRSLFCPLSLSLALFLSFSLSLSYALSIASPSILTLCAGVFCNNCTSHRASSTSSKKKVRACTECNDFLVELGENEGGSPSLERKLMGKLDDGEHLDLGATTSPSAAVSPADIRNKAKTRASMTSGGDDSPVRQRSSGVLSGKPGSSKKAANVAPLGSNVPTADRVENGAAALSGKTSLDESSPFSNSTNASLAKEPEDAGGSEVAASSNSSSSSDAGAAAADLEAAADADDGPLLGGNYLDVSPTEVLESEETAPANQPSKAAPAPPKKKRAGGPRLSSSASIMVRKHLNRIE